nr:GNAT family N-acetyltransferase [Micromonospora sp. DSM 115978]
MVTPLVIREVRVEDLATVSELDEIIFGHLAYPYFVLRQMYDTHAGELLLAEENGKSVGYSLAVGTSTPRLGWFLGLGVDPAYRCRGLGSRLAQTSLFVLYSKGIRRVRLSVDAKNVPAVGLYHKLGFELVDEVDDYLGPGEPRQVLELTLGEHHTRWPDHVLDVKFGDT